MGESRVEVPKKSLPIENWANIALTVLLLDRYVFKYYDKTKPYISCHFNKLKLQQ